MRNSNTRTRSGAALAACLLVGMVGCRTTPTTTLGNVTSPNQVFELDTVSFLVPEGPGGSYDIRRSSVRNDILFRRDGDKPGHSYGGILGEAKVKGSIEDSRDLWRKLVQPLIMGFSQDTRLEINEVSFKVDPRFGGLCIAYYNAGIDPGTPDGSTPLREGEGNGIAFMHPHFPGRLVILEAFEFAPPGQLVGDTKERLEKFLPNLILKEEL